VLDCDTVILDLEDAVAPDMKVQARQNAVAAVQAHALGRREVVVRINALDTPWGHEDLAAVARAGPDAILVPKVNGPEDILRYAQALSGALPIPAFWAMIETTKSLFRLADIAALGADGRLKALVVGTNDLAKEMRAELDAERAPVLGALGLVVAAGRSYGLAILDGVFNDLDDGEGFAGQCRQGRSFGFDGKTLIHPKQIVPCHDVFSPTEDALIVARRVIAAFDEPQNQKLGAIRVDGRMVERLHLDEARHVLAIAKAISSRKTAAAQT
jgi:citrate lyase subunit beta/citryl-CoA lyase